MNDKDTSLSSRKRIALAAGMLGVAGALVVLFVLPAETGIDLTGFGARSGLNEISNPSSNAFLDRGRKRAGVLTPGKELPPEPGLKDQWTYELKPFEAIELKYVLEKGAPIKFSWSANGPLAYDMHAHPFEGGEALTESYAIAKAASQSGKYVAAFSGIHGWHWQNRSTNTVRLTLSASGQLKGSKLIDATGPHDRELTP